MNKREEQVEEIPRGLKWVVSVYSVGPRLHFFETIESGRVTNRNLNHKLGWTLNWKPSKWVNSLSLFI